MADIANENARLREEAESLRVKLEATLAECVELKRKSDLASPEVGSLLTSRAASMPYWPPCSRVANRPTLCRSKTYYSKQRRAEVTSVPSSIRSSSLIGNGYCKIGRTLPLHMLR